MGVVKAYKAGIKGLQNAGRALAADTAKKQALQKQGKYRPGN